MATLEQITARPDREIRYNILLSSLEPWELHALCARNAERNEMSLELFFHDHFVFEQDIHELDIMTFIQHIVNEES